MSCSDERYGHHRPSFACRILGLDHETITNLIEDHEASNISDEHEDVYTLETGGVTPYCVHLCADLCNHKPEAVLPLILPLLQHSDLLVRSYVLDVSGVSCSTPYTVSTCL